MQNAYKLRVSDEIRTLIRGLHPFLKRSVKAALKEICDDPNCGKGLKEALAGLRSYRIKRFRIIYKVPSKREIVLVAVGPRKYIYEATFRVIQKHR